MKVLQQDVHMASPWLALLNLAPGLAAEQSPYTALLRQQQSPAGKNPLAH